MNGMTEEEYELELLGVDQEEENELNSDDERYDIEEALYQSMHYAETIVDNKIINECKNKPKARLESHEIQEETSSPLNKQLDIAEKFATDNISLYHYHNTNITNIDSENSKYCLTNTSKKSINILVNNYKDESKSETDIILHNIPKEQVILKDANSQNDYKLPKDSDSDDECCILIESASEDEKMLVHFASKRRKDDVLSATRISSASKVPRYFEEPPNTTMTGKCFNCKQTGHYMSDCPEDKKPVACIMCGLQGHYYKQCPNQLCFNCDLPGHENKSCTKKRIHWTTLCKRCYMPGHVMITCADRWRQFHLTTKSKPKLLYGAEENMKQSYCYNCGKDGHLGFECRADRMERYVKVNYPFVCNYSYKQFTYMAFTKTDSGPDGNIEDKAEQTEKETKTKSKNIGANTKEDGSKKTEKEKTTKKKKVPTATLR